MERLINTKFYTFNQNNSGGSFEKFKKQGISEYVIIEAFDADHANEKAENIGIYFDGCENGYDCSCCGDRWYRVDESDGCDIPLIYGLPPQDKEKSFSDTCYIHYIDASFEEIKFKEKNQLNEQ